MRNMDEYKRQIEELVVQQISSNSFALGVDFHGKCVLRKVNATDA